MVRHCTNNLIERQAKTIFKWEKSALKNLSYKPAKKSTNGFHIKLLMLLTGIETNNFPDSLIFMPLPLLVPFFEPPLQ
jgi:hypothetical protein